MGKLVIRSSTVNEAYTINYDSQETFVNASVKSGIDKHRKLIITSKNGFVIDAENFTHGVLPPGIGSVLYKNSSNNIDNNNQVIALVEISDDFTTTKDSTVFDIPISGFGSLPRNKVEILEKTTENKYIIIQDISIDKIQSSNPVVDGNFKSTAKTAYGKPGLKVLLIRKSFTAANGYYFAIAPSYNIESFNKSSYKVITQNRYDDKRRLTSKTFDVYYSFPSQRARAIDTITFDASAKPANIKKTEAGYSTALTPTIYSFDSGVKANIRGGNQIISVKGTPGTPFKVLIQNDAKEVYDVEQGTFVSGGKFIEGIIPAMRQGIPYGEYRAMIKIPANTSGDSIQMRLRTEKNVVNTITEGGAGADLQGGTVDNTTTAQSKNVTITLAIRNLASESIFSLFKNTCRLLDNETYRVISEELKGQNGTIIGPGVYRAKNSYTYEFEWEVGLQDSADQTTRFRIIRQPRYTQWDGKASSATQYTSWGCEDGSSTCADANNKDMDANSVSIVSDWEVSDNFENKYDIQTKVEGLGRPVYSTGAASGDTDTYAYYKNVLVKGVIRNVTFGKDNPTVNLELNNFLSSKAI